MNSDTIQDVDVDHAEAVTMEVIVNTCNKFFQHSRITHEIHLVGTATELSLEL